MNKLIEEWFFKVIERPAGIKPKDIEKYLENQKKYQEFLEVAGKFINEN